MEKIQHEKDETVKMWRFFQNIWKKRPHFSEVSGEYLGEIPYTYMFDHALEKSTYPHLKFEEENIILCTLEEHSKKTQGFPLPKHRELMEVIKLKYL